MIDRIAFVLGETFIGLRRNFLLGFAAVVTLAIALYVLAGMTYLGSRAGAYIETIQGRFEMIVNLKEGTSRAGFDRTIKYLRQTPGVQAVVGIPRQMAWERFRRESPEIARGLGEESPYLDAIKVRLSDLSKTDAVAGKAKKMSTVESVKYFGEAQNAVARWIAVGRTLSRLLGILLLAVTGIVTFNSVSMAVASRTTEIRIMRLVGASRFVVAFPFALEGVVQGALGGALAAYGLQISQRVIENLLREMKVDVLFAPFPMAAALVVLTGVGAGYGALCSLLALVRPMRMRRNG